MKKPTSKEIDGLNKTIAKGGEALAAQNYLLKTRLERLWRAMQSMANCAPDLPTLLKCQAELRVILTEYQRTELDKIAGKEAARELLNFGIGRES
jgi:hypothetical protein